MCFDDRLAKLEAIEEIRLRVLAFFESCDNGGASGETYDANALADMWVPDGRFESGPVHCRTRDEIRALFLDLAQTFSLHYAGNHIVDIEPCHRRATGSWKAWESPILSGRAVWGCFEHRHEYTKRDGRWSWTRWDQTIHFFVPTERTWIDEPRIVEQLISKGA